jgi:phosphoglucosamine mutase
MSGAGRKYFGTDGIRGRVGEAPITPDFVMRLGYAAGRVLARNRSDGTDAAHGARGDRPAVLIGKDTRISGYMLESALQAGFSAAGVDVMLAGPVPTPAVAYLTRALRLSAGIVISASHNPYDDNGIKFFSAAGNKLADEVEQRIEDELEGALHCQASAHLGRARRIDDARGRYIEFCKSSFPNELDLRGLRIVVDCAHGAAYHVAGEVFHELGAEVEAIGVSPDGLNINAGVGATRPAALTEAVLSRRADLGIALDGDGDRVLMVDGAGRQYDGDAMLYVIARYSAIPPKGVVGTLMTNLGLALAFERLGIAFARARVGDRYVLEMMLENGWTLGGENSGHIICLDRHTTGDGIIAALQVLTAMRRQRATLAELTADLSCYPQTLINVAVPRGFDWQAAPHLAETCRKVELALGKTGRVLLRPSGTEPVLRVMVEGEDARQVQSFAESIAAAVRV